MIQLGKYNKLVANRREPQGIYLLEQSSAEEVLLPNAYIEASLQIGDTIEVFVYLDSEERPIATTIKPKAIVDQVALLEIVDTSDHGAWADWGLAKQLLVPFSEQNNKLRKGQKAILLVRLDNTTNRIIGTTKIKKALFKAHHKYQENQEVKVLIANKTPLGYNAIVDQKYTGLIYYNDIFEPINYGDIVTGYIKKERKDGNLDISLRPQGYKKNIDNNAQKVLDNLNKAKENFLPLHDKSNPELIYQNLKMSKKAFKKAIGNLYKNKLIKIKPKGIELIKKS